MQAESGGILWVRTLSTTNQIRRQNPTMHCLEGLFIAAFKRTQD